MTQTQAAGLLAGMLFCSKDTQGQDQKKTGPLQQFNEQEGLGAEGRRNGGRERKRERESEGGRVEGREREREGGREEGWKVE